MTDVERLLVETRNLPPDQRKRFVSLALSELGEEDAARTAAGEIRGQVNGDWYETADGAPDGDPDYLPTGAVLPESSELGDEGFGLDLVQLDDGWFPLSVAGMYTYSHSSNLRYGRECYFKRRMSGSVYRVELAGELDRNEVLRRFGVAAADRVRADRNTILLRLTRL